MRKSLVIVVLLFVGCKSNPPQQVKVWTPRVNTKAAVLVGLTQVDTKAYNGWDGYCPGSDKDINALAEQLSKKRIPYALLFNSKATSANVISMCREASTSLKDGGLLFVYFSGHGGQIPGHQNETDGKDETLCLWDGQLRDDVVWALLTSIDPARNIKVFMVTDCCNSGTNYRHPRNYASSLRSRVYTARGERKYVIPNLCHWGGCGDSEVSYGYPGGGAFTLAWRKTFGRKMTYRQTQDYIKNRLTNQIPSFSVLGVFDLDKEVFD